MVEFSQSVRSFCTGEHGSPYENSFEEEITREKLEEKIGPTGTQYFNLNRYLNFGINEGVGFFDQIQTRNQVAEIIFGIISNFSNEINNHMERIVFYRMFGTFFNPETSEIFQGHLAFDTTKINAYTQCQQLLQSIRENVNTRQTEYGIDYMARFYPTNINVAVGIERPMAGGCLSWGEKYHEIGDFFVFSPRSINYACFFACIRKFYAFTNFQKLPIFMEEDTDNISHNLMTFSASAVRQKLKIPKNTPINLDHITRICRLFKMKVDIYDKFGNTVSRIDFAHDLEKQWKNKFPSLLLENEHFYLIQRFPQSKNAITQAFKCDNCSEMHNTAEDIDFCFRKIRRNFAVDKCEDAKKNNIFFSLVKFGTKINSLDKRTFFPKIRHFQKTEHSSQIKDINTEEVCVSEAGMIYFDLETFVDRENSNKGYYSSNISYQKCYAVGFSMTDLHNPAEEHKFGIKYGKNCLKEFFDELQEYGKLYYNYYKDVLRKKKRNKTYNLTIKLCAYWGSGFDFPILLNHIVYKESHRINFDNSKLVYKDSKMISAGFFFNDLQLNNTGTCPDKNKKYTKNNPTKIASKVRFEFIDLNLFIPGSLAKAGLSFNVPKENLKTFFPHRIIGKWGDIYGTKTVEWKDFNPTDYNNENSKKAIEEMYGISDQKSAVIPIEKTVKEYLKRDVECLKIVFKNYARTVKSVMNMDIRDRMTGSQLAYESWLLSQYVKCFQELREKKIYEDEENRFLEYIELNNGLKNPKNNIQNILHKHLPPLTTDPYKKKFEDDSFFGGRTIAKKIWKSSQYDEIVKNANFVKQKTAKYSIKSDTEGLVFHDENIMISSTFDYKNVTDYMVYYDVNSLYPTSLIQDFYPMGDQSEMLTEEEIEKLNEKIQQDKDFLVPGIFYCEVDTNGYRTLSLLSMRYKNKRLGWNYGYGKTVVCSESIRGFLKFGYNVKLIEGFTWKKYGCFFKEFIGKGYEQRLKFKKEGKESAAMVMKFIMNSTYGKFGQKLEPSKSIIVQNKQELVQFMKNYSIKNMELIDNKIEIISGIKYSITKKDLTDRQKSKYISIFCTAISRNLMQEICDAMNPNSRDEKFEIAYMDTDSFVTHVSNFKRGFGENEDKTFPSKLYHGFTHKIDAKEIGALKNELPDKKIISFVGIAPKVYAYETINKKNEIEYCVKCKGVPTSSITYDDFVHLRDNPFSERNFNFFKMTRSGFNPQKNSDILSITSGIDSRTLNKKKYDGMTYFELEKSFHSKSVEEMQQEFKIYPYSYTKEYQQNAEKSCDTDSIIFECEELPTTDANDATTEEESEEEDEEIDILGSVNKRPLNLLENDEREEEEQQHNKKRKISSNDSDYYDMQFFELIDDVCDDIINNNNF